MAKQSTKSKGGVKKKNSKQVKKTLKGIENLEKVVLAE
jgi:hypothetical protein